jgi:peptide/nickel transport system permease protein
MSGNEAALPRSTGLKLWLTTNTPRSGWQAACGRFYRGWRAFARNPLGLVGLGIVILLLLCAAFAPWIATADPMAQDLALRLQPPSAAHWLGTDRMGRDTFSDLIYGSRVTLYIVVLVLMISAPVGLLIGSTAGYLGGRTDQILMRITDIFFSFPRLVLALAFVASLGPGLNNAIIAIALTAWPAYARVARAETLAVRRSDFISAVRAQGAGNWRIIFRHIMPLSLPSVIVRATLDMAGVILTAAGLGFLGLGAQPPTPEWGAMIAVGRQNILDQWWVAAVPGMAIFIVSLGFNLLGDGLRDVLDPKMT